MGRLLQDLSAYAMAVIDFEFTTPTGVRPEPIEVAVQTLRVQRGTLVRGWRFEALIKPPEHAWLTAFDTAQTGITETMLSTAPPVEQILPELERRFDTDRWLLVAHHAPAEARILREFRALCPRVAGFDMFDTVRLARDALPELPGHTLDEVLRALAIPVPLDRHRAMPDVQATTDALLGLLLTIGRWPDLPSLRAVGRYAGPAVDTQEALF